MPIFPRAPGLWRDMLKRAFPLRVGARSLALGVAAGIFVAILPIPGLQTVAAIALASAVRGHLGAATVATFAANPVTYPLIWVASYLVGSTMLGIPVSNAAHDIQTISTLMAEPWRHATPLAGRLVPLLGTLAIGAVPLAFMSAALAYAGVRLCLMSTHERWTAIALPSVSSMAWRLAAGHHWRHMASPAAWALPNYETPR